ncbi:MAG: YigZ family protein [Desulfitobacteriaceae bacterium]|nr:YigZ family protein [Desulfitobacteriaceae bacterium]MDI6877818.1 YigZ family protein [Desulfitobacteriaceae bacterium]MDI6912843.1 YigZ family protein [Desulfitobacteriaceae bacterium]
MEGYLTLRERAVWEQVIEKSRFIGVAYPVKTLENVQAGLEEVRDVYPGARHYVYAYRLAEGKLEKSSDDGEPQGTGGRPVLDLLSHRQVWNVLIVVVRYFGGILLGTGGLTRAYGGTARQLLDQARLTHLTRYVLLTLKVPYPWYERLKYQFQFKPWFIEQEDFGEVIEVKITVPQDQEREFVIWLEEFTRLKVTYLAEGVVWQAAPAERRM